MKIIEILKARKAIASIYTDKISAKLAYKFTKFLKETDTEEKFYREKLQSIMRVCGEKDKHGNLIEADGGIKVKDSEKDKCITLIMELEATDVDAPSTIFSIDELGDIRISTEDMIALFAFIKE